MERTNGNGNRVGLDYSAYWGRRDFGSASHRTPRTFLVLDRATMGGISLLVAVFALVIFFNIVSGLINSRRGPDYNPNEHPSQRWIGYALTALVLFVFSGVYYFVDPENIYYGHNVKQFEAPENIAIIS